MVSSWKGRRVGVLGAGRSGAAAARMLYRLGSRVLLSESSAALSFPAPKAIDVETGGHSKRLLECEILVRSPGVPNDAAILRQARRRRIPILSELEVASCLIKPKRLIAITGTNGKTTTTTLVGEIFRAWKPSTLVAGNIGTPLSAVVGKVRSRAPLVLEVSSYQLENIERFHPTISAILNVTPDHLEHHHSLRAYAEAKARIFENQIPADVCVLNQDDAICRAFAKRCRAQVLFFSRRKPLRSGVYFEQGQIVVNWRKVHARWPLVWSLPGGHNIENALAAVGIAVAGGVPTTLIERTLTHFRGVKHRLEVVRIRQGVRYINDSKATNVDSTRVALESFDEPLILIMGGRGKGVPYTFLGPRIKAQVRRLLLIGEDGARIEQDLGAFAACEQVGTLDRAVARAAEVAHTGDVVLLSPACASFDQYANYEERGRHFKKLVGELE